MTQGEILVYATLEDGRLSSLTLELLGAGNTLASAAGATLAAALLAPGAGDLGQELAAYGAERVYLAEDPDLATYRSDPHLEILEQLCLQNRPAVVLFGHDSTGRDLAPRLAARLGTGMAPDCTGLTMDPDSHRLLATRPLYGGNLQATLAIDGDPQIATLRPKVIDAAIKADGKTAETVKLTTSLDSSCQRVKLLERVREQTGGLRLEDAEVIVTGGRGIEDQEGVKIIEELARTLGAAVGATRGSVDAGLFPGEYQVGLTGKMVAPRLYFAIGVSGSMQHLAGCGASKKIIAINTDPDAPIFQRASYGIVGDFRSVVPALTEKLKGV